MNIFFRTKQDPIEYYAANPIIESRRPGHVSVHWGLKKIGTDKTIIFNSNDIAEKYEVCSPYEALSATKM